MNPEETFYGYVYTNDFTVSRTFRFGQKRVRGFMEIFNLMNLSTIYTRNETFGPQFYNPIDLVGSQRFQFGVQLDF
jgi:hypothetical protein